MFTYLNLRHTKHVRLPSYDADGALSARARKCYGTAVSLLWVCMSAMYPVAMERSLQCTQAESLLLLLQGAYALREGQDKVLRRIGVVFQESIPDESSQPLRLPGDPVATPAAPSKEARAPVDTHAARVATATGAGPARRPSSPPAGQLDAAASDQNRSSGSESPEPQVKGPAAPSAALRAAAADAAAAMRSEGLLGDILEGVPAQLVGPVPAALLAEAETSAEGTRDAEVSRIIAVLDKAKRAGALGVHHALVSPSWFSTPWECPVVLRMCMCA